MTVKFQGNPVTLEGNKIYVGDEFSDFTAAKNDLSPLTLKDTRGVRVFLTVPSLDTPVCDLEIRTFNERAADLEGVTVYTVSLDLPFAQSRWCGAEGIENVVTVSDYKDRSFGKATGTYIKELGLLARAAFVVNSANKVVYADYVEEITSQPDFDAVIKAAEEAK